ncbi:Phage-related protein, tail component [Kluyvera cryocrescens]|uniref:Phage-related protein, tail component n=1 Tax=Kluyvera cryocrescens TaxID=580 RepID=A0A485A5V0_KLUCR|nr:Phage-related protein, tail component [Kluyvera cryocrescens]
MARLTTIRLYGALGARFGRVHKLAVQTSAEAVKALCINLDGMESYLMNAKKKRHDVCGFSWQAKTSASVILKNWPVTVIFASHP